ncbi:phosphate transport system permease protein [Actinoalloteichus hoggarensis]|uniref:Phosphate transport system permease protein n=1 Tax=Actinoalloteichus hoggarensis TaxID=1470176 RepID=A0A221WBF3_9PSEU|nr:phosphate ABC transporter permease subunit PstC [Actinoalloteichus hoggarensis]ASO22973.1 Phosphate transport system permease protein PstC [Actinoalloteichus hoggarensis]MBB5922576.1 phosphate transport system permease protein [Actinoalloteichus hoggarensis]
MSDSTRRGRSLVTGSGSAPSPDAPEEPISTAVDTSSKPVRRPGDRIFRGFALGSGTFVVVLIGAIGLFLLLQAIPSLAANQSSFLFSGDWNASNPNDLRFGILYLLYTTVSVSLLALVLAMPVSLGIALFLTQYAPRSLARPFAYIVDLLAAVPSVIFGLWGIQVIGPAMVPVAEWLNTNLSFIPIFEQGNVSIAGAGNIFTAGVVVAVMLLPIITAISREVFERTPREHIEGALALGATKWEVVRTTVWPFGKSGYVSAAMLGLGRALGETVALFLILSSTTSAPSFSVFDGGATIASRIAAASAEFSNPLSIGAYIAAGLVLFVLTFLVNAVARSIVGGKKERS